MLVVSRKENERVTFPNLGISVEILRIAGNAVKVGIEAPRDVHVLRGELTTDQSRRESYEASRRQCHDFRNRLNTANLALHLLQRQIDAGQLDDAEDTLAKALDAFAELDGLASAATVRASRGRTVAGRRALVVEDSANERELLAGVLRLCGYEVDTVADGLAAMTYLASHERPDIVLLDMQMPRMDGRKTISAIRRNPSYRDIKLFAVSGLDRASLDVPLGKRGVDRWFTKPLHPDEFIGELDTELASDHVVA